MRFLSNLDDDITTLDLKIVTYNILAPCYNRIMITADDGTETKVFESDLDSEGYIARNRLICEKLRETDADVICIQEFWSDNAALRALFLEELCQPKKLPEPVGGKKQIGYWGSYTMKELKRTSHWRTRDDGIAMLVKDDRIIIQDVRNLLFHDCGDRVAMLMLLAVEPPPKATEPSSSKDQGLGLGLHTTLSNDLSNEKDGLTTTNPVTAEPELPPLQQFVCVNTHLLFPHNEFSTRIRLREITKILGYIESYKQRELCTDFCGRADVSAVWLHC